MEQRGYVRRLLETCCETPGTTGTVRRPDRLFAVQLHERGVPLETVENALTPAAARRLTRHADTPQLEVIRSPAYFSPVTEEVLQRKLSPEEQAALEQIRAKFRRVESEPKSPFGHVKF